MTKLIMHGCNGKMGQVISKIVKEDPNVEMAAGIDAYTGIANDYPVFESIEKCDIKADAIIDFSNAAAVNGLLDYCVEKQIPVVLCTTGLSEEQLKKVEETSKKVAVLKSANMSLGVNMLLKLLQDAAKVLATAGFDIEIVEKHHNQKVDAPSGTALAMADSIGKGSGGNGSNIAADMASMQMGMMMGQQMANQMAQPQNNNQQQNINQNQNNNQQPVNPQGGGNVAKFCPNCGTPNNAGSNFCPNCGTKLIL